MYDDSDFDEDDPILVEFWMMPKDMAIKQHRRPMRLMDTSIEINLKTKNVKS